MPLPMRFASGSSPRQPQTPTQRSNETCSQPTVRPSPTNSETTSVPHASPSNHLRNRGRTGTFGVRQAGTLASEAEAIASKEVEGTDTVDLSEAEATAADRLTTPETKIVIEAGQSIAADRDLLILMIENLIRNSAEHGGNDGTVRIIDTENGFVVVDDGPGFESEDPFAWAIRPTSDSAPDSPLSGGSPRPTAGRSQRRTTTVLTSTLFLKAAPSLD